MKTCSLNAVIAAGLMFGCLMSALSSSAQTNASLPLTAGEPIPLPGTSGRFDFIRVDTANDRLLLDDIARQAIERFDQEHIEPAGEGVRHACGSANGRGNRKYRDSEDGREPIRASDPSSRAEARNPRIRWPGTL